MTLVRIIEWMKRVGPPTRFAAKCFEDCGCGVDVYHKADTSGSADLIYTSVPGLQAKNIPIVTQLEGYDGASVLPGSKASPKIAETFKNSLKVFLADPNIYLELVGCGINENTIMMPNPAPNVTIPPKEHSAFTVLCPQGVWSIKKPQRVVECARIVGKEEPKIKFVMPIGSKVWRCPMDWLELNNMEFLPRLPYDRMLEEYAKADIIAPFSAAEILPFTVFEGFISGKPVIVDAIGKIQSVNRKYVGDMVSWFGTSSRIFDEKWRDKYGSGEGDHYLHADSAEKLAKLVLLLYDDEKKRLALGNHALEWVNSYSQDWKPKDRGEKILELVNFKVKDTTAFDAEFLKEAPKVSVIVAVKNRVRSIGTCLDSILAEGYPNLEVIIADGASTDGTLEILREYEKRYNLIKVISEPDNNQSEARNKALKIASGDYVTFLDSDDEQVYGKLTSLAEFLFFNDKYSAVFGNHFFRLPNGKVYANNKNVIPDEISFETLNKTNYIGSGSIMLRNTPEIRFDEDKRFGEDYLLWMKLIMKYNFAHADVNTYYWTSGGPDGIGTQTKNWREIDIQRKVEAKKIYSASPYKEKMRIAIFCDSFGVHPYGGPAIYGYNVCEMLFKSRMFYVMFYNPYPQWRPHPDYCRRPEVLKPMRNINTDDFNVFYVMGSPGAIKMLNGKGVSPIIGSNHVPNSAPKHCLKYFDEAYLKSQKGMAECERNFIRTCKGKFWFAQSEFQRNEYKRLGMDLNKTKVYLAPNPIDTYLFKKRGELGDAIIWSGKNNWAKGIPFLKEVCCKLPKQKFVCLSEQKLPSLPANTTSITGNTLFKIPRLLHKGKIFLSTSVTENQPCAALEAMACELPVVGFRTSGMPEIMKDGETGFLVELGDTDAMTEKIKVLLRDESLRREMGRRGREYVLKEFSYSSCLDKYLGYFKMYLEEPHET